MPLFKSRIKSALAHRREQGLTRQLKVLENSNSPLLNSEGSNFINFSSNDYLGLANDPELVDAWQTGLSQYGAGSAASPLVTGFSPAHLNLEAQLCEWLGFERAILFSSGFSANQALLFSLLEKDDSLLQDKLNHASLMEAGMLSPATMKRFKHNDTQHLESLLSQSPQSLVVTEGVFSMDGDQAPLSQIFNLTHQYDSWLVVDDAHGIGVLGDKGAGSCSAAQISPDILVVTFGKAFGLSGAAILCSLEVGDYLTQFARHHVYSTAMPPSQAVALSHACQMIQTQEWRREKLMKLGAIYAEEMSGVKGFIDTQTPIKPFVIGEAQAALSVAEELKRKQVWVTAIRPPTVPKGTARLRITLTANHSEDQIHQLTRSLHQAIDRSSESGIDPSLESNKEAQ
ncbi:8-amino-7-oxononanoate synthase [Vibrio cyclitrophicus]|uniref:8-amino-7-oxononanoate synthase n=1 Tax=Vibrio cyclitrophicus ZF270 TaxID=1136176 RepID=A0AAN0LRF2_9VIBR|nr:MULTISPECIES: 8-amino-7-oxononanoate synthase [Vibrio]ERM61278.1 8-amino-7-oxononanoate synthase [Vibrio cyclitrophicus FF75]MBE8605571.1 8-amino-7-oxononanoate synthase [Vibrio sp. OPT10]MCC4775295.1 8-amino-7-oxononanoate synthase [Vibrio cyclitrophicus]MCC4840370.1 8-amino-7-oxononanoate synthase [Vibrio cyclitrophicus]OBS93928.1 8-amino-7-oxononanoate synthase [Vibrio cyclitrophicus]